MQGIPTGGMEAAFSTETVEDLRASLPDNWYEGTPALVERIAEDEGLLSTYRIGRSGDTRLLDVRSNEAGEVTGFSIEADPDNR